MQLRLVLVDLPRRLLKDIDPLSPDLCYAIDYLSFLLLRRFAKVVELITTLNACADEFSVVLHAHAAVVCLEGEDADLIPNFRGGRRQRDRRGCQDECVLERDPNNAKRAFPGPMCKTSISFHARIMLARSLEVPTLQVCIMVGSVAIADFF